MAARELTSILSRSKTSISSDELEKIAQQIGIKPDYTKDFIKIGQRPRSDILNDQPVANDAFNVTELVQTIGNVILAESTQTPITLAIDGKWGTGKTSFLRILETYARMLRFSCIWLNAWGFTNTQNMIQAIGVAVEKELRSSGRDISKLPRKVPEQDSLMPQHFQTLVDALIDSSKQIDRVIVFIDDLDRSFPDQIVDILRNLKLILEVPNCVFILAMDTEIVINSIQTYYRYREQQMSNLAVQTITLEGSFHDLELKNAGNDNIQVIDQKFGKNYLEKIIQISVHIPPLSRKQLQKYLEEIGIAEEVQEIIHWTPDEIVTNPRRLKRYINQLSVSLQLLLSARALPVSALDGLRLIALRRDYAEAYNLFVQRYQQSGLDSLDWQPIYQQISMKRGMNSTEEVALESYLRSISPDSVLKFDQFIHANPLIAQ